LSEAWSALCAGLAEPAGAANPLHELQRIEAFIAYFNQTMAKPFRWTMKGRPLTV